MKKIQDFIVKENRRLNADTFVLVLFSKEMPAIQAGQFVNVKVEHSPETFLRRPISIHNVDVENGLLYLMIKIAGAGTAMLSTLKEGDTLNLLLPLGNWFNQPTSGKCLLVGGGVGIAPMLHLAKELCEKGMKPTLLIGVRSAKDIVLKEEFEKYADLYYTTEDGSYGEKGYPTQHSILEQQFDKIFCCGPDPMMKAVARYAYSTNTPCEVSLENTMACGIGACLCCVNDTKEGHKCVCTDGPVFNINDLKWQN
ncbi:MAG: dihydroorotate dehydrogenase electron transfer subunit [Marinifilaceae bacterium]